MKRFLDFIKEDIRKMDDGSFGVYADLKKDGKRVLTKTGKHRKKLFKKFASRKRALKYQAAIMIGKGGG